MNKTIIQSALTMSEPDPYIHSEANIPKYLSFGMDKFLAAITTDMVKMKAASGLSELDIATHCTLYYLFHFWRFAKTIYDFSPTFLAMLEQTEDAPIYPDILKRLPYRDFVMSLPSGLDYDGMFVHIEFDESYGANDVDTLFLLCPFKSSSSPNNISYTLEMQWVLSKKMFRKTYRDYKTAMDDAAKNGEGRSGDITIHSAPDDQPIVDIDARNADYTLKERLLCIAVAASYYLASKNAEIKEVKIPQSQRTIAPVKGKGRPKRVAIKAYQVGYTFGKSFEQQVTAQNTVRDQAVGQRNGLTVRPHVRRAHWHHYWTGAGRTILEVRWIQPTLVLPNEKKETELATIRKVSGDSASTTSV